MFRWSRRRGSMSVRSSRSTRLQQRLADEARGRGDLVLSAEIMALSDRLLSVAGKARWSRNYRRWKRPEEKSGYSAAFTERHRSPSTPPRSSKLRKTPVPDPGLGRSEPVRHKSRLRANSWDFGKNEIVSSSKTRPAATPQAACSLDVAGFSLISRCNEHSL